MTFHRYVVEHCLVKVIDVNPNALWVSILYRP